MNPFRERQMLRWQEIERRRIAGGVATRQRWPARLGRSIALVWKAVVAGTLRLLGATSVILVVAVFIDALAERTITVQPLSVPKSIAEAGFTADVASLRLRDAINQLIEQAKTRLPPQMLMPYREILRQADVMDAVVPTVGISVQTLAAQVRTFLGIKRHQDISGEITTSNGLLSLTLRLDGKPFYTSPQGVDREQPFDLFPDAARAALRASQPYIFATLVYDSDKGLSLSIVETFIAASPKGSSEARYAHALRASALNDLGRRDEAMAECKAAIALDPKDASPHDCLGVVLNDLGRLLGRRDEAMAEFKTAIALDPKFADPHDGLGVVLHDLGRHDEAMAEFKTAIALDPKFAGPHDHLGAVLNDLGRRDEAMAELNTAIALDPKFADPHDHLGVVLNDLGRRDEAMAELNTAIALDPKFADPHFRRGIVLRDLGRPDEARAEFKAAIALDPTLSIYVPSMPSVSTPK